ncbi:TPA: hypothetical protein N0F65_001973 [Lagenidium giganteum]|uniref:Uncharacterized protein n=1 Tax=Lagenidium giganteum TaxID=4803 RepID=A0AAV2YNY4_9STRA|nr:TPA: hypothetical protein N0F65_001973 [Lagenidium giganteum]
MATKRINGIIKKLDWKEVEATLFSTERDDADPGFEDGRIYIVELPTEIHDNFCRDLDFAILTATGTGYQHLRPRGSSYVESLRKLEPDCSFGPPPGIGAARPAGMDWGEYHTKADQWRQFPGVEYILCIRISPALRVRQYKLHTVPIPIVNPTNVAFNSRRLLGLVGRGRTPQGFSRPNVVLDLFPLVERLI